MGFNKKFFTTGGIVASTPPAAAGLDPLQNFETVTYTGTGATQKITGYIRKGGAFNGSSSKIDLPLTTLGDSSFTISLWINFNSVGSGSTEQYIFSKYDNAPSGQYGMLCTKAANSPMSLAYGVVWFGKDNHRKYLGQKIEY